MRGKKSTLRVIRHENRQLPRHTQQHNINKSYLKLFTFKPGKNESFAKHTRHHVIQFAHGKLTEGLRR